MGIVIGDQIKNSPDMTVKSLNIGDIANILCRNKPRLIIKTLYGITFLEDGDCFTEADVYKPLKVIEVLKPGTILTVK